MKKGEKLMNNKNISKLLIRFMLVLIPIVFIVNYQKHKHNVKVNYLNYHRYLF